MSDSSDSQPPSRAWGVALLGLAAVGFYLASSPAMGWSPGVRRGVLLGFCALFLLAHSVLAPATLSYALMLDLRRRGRQWFDPAGRGERKLDELVAKARWIDLTVPFVLTLLLFAIAWLALEALVGPALPALELSRTVYVTAVLALVVMPLAVLLPGRAANRGADRVSRVADGLVLGSVAVLRPFLGPVAWVAERCVARGDLDQASSSLPEDDLADVIEVGSHQGDLSLVQSELLRRELDFARHTAADVMVPRVQVEYLDVEMPVEEARRHVIESHFSRFPVQHGSVDNVVAVLHVRTLLEAALHGAPESLHKLLALQRQKPPLHVRHDQSLEEVLEALRRERASLAIVDDAYGGVAGILTVEDVVEELVGEIVDESDAEQALESVVVSGRRQLSELREHGIELPGDGELTVAEFLADELGEEVTPGQVWRLGDLLLVIESTDGAGGVETVRAELVLHGDEGDSG